MLFNKEPFAFNIDELEKLAEHHRDSYINAKPFQHIVLEDFLPKNHANSLLKVFPKQSSKIWLDWRKRDTIHQPKKQGIGNVSRLNDVSPYLLNVLSAFNSYPFLNFLEKLTGIEKLLPDPYFNGGGLQQVLNGGKLAIHADFNELKSLNLYRRLNALFYLNKNWKTDYNGDLELWGEDLKRCEKSISPSFNKLVVFNTNKKSFHGHPKPLNTPDNVTRKSIALYYYTANPSPGDMYDCKTDWQDIATN